MYLSPCFILNLSAGDQVARKKNQRADQSENPVDQGQKHKQEGGGYPLNRYPPIHHQASMHAPSGGRAYAGLQS